jgi:hypothetical protein
VTVTEREIICYAIGKVKRRESGGTVSEKRTVILCGKSLLIDGIALNLKNSSEFHVITAAEPAEVRKILGVTKPAAVIVDSSTGQDQFETLVHRYPTTLIIAVNPENSAALVYSQDQVSSTDDLKNMIYNHSRPKVSGCRNI